MEPVAVPGPAHAAAVVAHALGLCRSRTGPALTAVVGGPRLSPAVEAPPRLAAGQAPAGRGRAGGRSEDAFPRHARARSADSDDRSAGHERAAAGNPPGCRAAQPGVLYPSRR